MVLKGLYGFESLLNFWLYRDLSKDKQYGVLSFPFEVCGIKNGQKEEVGVDSNYYEFHGIVFYVFSEALSLKIN